MQKAIVVRRGSNTLAAVALVVGLLALAVAAYSAYPMAFPPPKKAPHIINYVIRTTTYNYGNATASQNLTGETFLVEGPLFPLGQADYPSLTIGNYTSSGTYSDSKGDNLSLQLLDVTGGGNGGVGILVADGPGPGAPNINYTGAIIGGTGDFAGAHGTYIQYISSDRTLLYYTMNFTTTAGT